MLINKLRIDSQLFHRQPEEDIAALKDQVFTAARGVSEFIVFTPIGHGQVSVLMTPHTPVRFEEEERSESQIARWEEDPPPTEIELDF
jgi:hypothetical protein